MVTKANPRDLPVNLCCMRVTSCTAPACAKSSCSSFSVVLKERFPTYNLVPIESILENAARSLFPLIGFQIATEYTQLTIHQLPSYRFRFGHISKGLLLRKQQEIEGQMGHLKNV